MKRPIFTKKVLSGTLPAFALLLSGAACNNPGPAPAKSTTPAPAQAASAPAAPSQDSSALQEAVITYVRDVKGLDTSKMDVVLKESAVNGTTAEATVQFKIKGSDMPPMTYLYSLEKSGGAWKVVSSKPASGEGHGAMPSGTMPEGHPPVSGQPAQTGAPSMASGH